MTSWKSNSIWNIQSDKKIKESLERLGFRNKRTSKAIEWFNLVPKKIQEAKERIGLVSAYTRYIGWDYISYQIWQ